jgi:hypothetical protein
VRRADVGRSRRARAAGAFALAVAGAALVVNDGFSAGAHGASAST